MENKLTERAVRNLRELAAMGEKMQNDRLAAYAAGVADGVVQAMRMMQTAQEPTRRTVCGSGTPR